MLAVRIHGQHMAVTLTLGLADAVQDRRPLAGILRQDEHADRLVGRGQAIESRIAPSVLPSMTTHTGAQCRRAARTVSISFGPEL